MTQPQPAPSPYYPPSSPPHSHNKYVAGIVAVALVSLIIGGAVGYFYGAGSSFGSRATASTPVPRTIWLTGYAYITPHSGTPLWIVFSGEGALDDLSAGIFTDDGYQLWIETGKTFTVKLYWDDPSLGTQDCSARPGIFTPTPTTISQDFSC